MLEVILAKRIRGNLLRRALQKLRLRPFETPPTSSTFTHRPTRFPAGRRNVTSHAYLPAISARYIN